MVNHKTRQCRNRIKKPSAVRKKGSLYENYYAGVAQGLLIRLLHYPNKGVGYDPLAILLSPSE